MEKPDARSSAFTDQTVPEAYDRLLGPPLFEPWARILLDMSAVQPGETVFDVASGTGIVARLASERVGEHGKVTASDISGAMLAVSRQQAAAAGLRNIQFIECSALALVAPDASQDVVVCQQGLPFFPDRVGALAEMLRVVRPGGRVTVAIWAAEHPMPLFGGHLQVVRSYVEAPYPGAFALDNYTMTGDAVRNALRAAGVARITAETRTVTAIFPDAEAAASTIQGTPMGPLVAHLPPKQRDEVNRALVGAYTRYAQDGRVRIPTFAHLAVGYKGE